jgi:hypothetical protein
VKREWWEAARASDIAPLLAHRRWWRHRQPFPHVQAVNVFQPEVYLALEDAFLAWLSDSGGGRPLDGHDLQGTTLTGKFDGPLRLFASSGWRDFVTGAMNTEVTCHVNLGLHHHRAYSDAGFPHTDLNPGFFPDEKGAGSGVVLADPARVEYTSGRTSDPRQPVAEVVRAVAVLFYLANPPWLAEHENCTGLYHAHGDSPADAVATVPPHSNSLLAFECTPWSFHGFQSGGSVGRNSVVQWFHRPTETVSERWGDHVVVGYGGGLR